MDDRPFPPGWTNTTKEPPVSTWEDPRPSYYANLDYPAQMPTAVTSTESKHDHKPTGSSYPAQGKSKKLGGLALGGLGGIAAGLLVGKAIHKGFGFKGMGGFKGFKGGFKGGWK
nr:7299_t:CDS:2 [Entrophospora candida]CAG8439634.1 2367_t:CDS:2 [Entrophospora candida]